MRDALPHLFVANPRLLYQLVTTLSPVELKARAWPCLGVPRTKRWPSAAGRGFAFDGRGRSALLAPHRPPAAPPRSAEARRAGVPRGP